MGSGGSSSSCNMSVGLLASGCIVIGCCDGAFARADSATVGATVCWAVGCVDGVAVACALFFGLVPSICILPGSPASAAARICWICAIRLPNFCGPAIPDGDNLAALLLPLLRSASLAAFLALSRAVLDCNCMGTSIAVAISASTSARGRA